MTASDAIEDPYVWLEAVTGDEPLAWVRERNDETLASLTGGDRFGDLRDETLAVLDSGDRIPYIRRRGGLFYNFWQDAEHPRGLWRRTTLESYRGGDPEWDLLLDVDALGQVEGENWVWAGAAVLRPEYHRALIELSRGGADATVVREFDLRNRAFVAPGDGGFFLPEAKSQMSWIDEDTVYVGTDTGPGSMTTSGYPRVIRRWRRGTPLAEAAVVFEGEETDVSAHAGHDDTEGYERDFVGCSPDFHTSREWLLHPDGARELIDVPADARTSVHREWLLVRPRSPWALGTTTHPEGSLLAFGFDDYLAGGREPRVLFTPTASRSLSYYAWTRHHLILAVLEDVVTRLEVLSPERDWESTPLPGAPEFGVAEVVGVDPDHSDEYLLDVSGYTQPSALLRGEVGDGSAPETLRQAPSFFDATGMVTRQFFAVSDDGTRIPYFVVGPEPGPESDRPGPTLMTGYGGFEHAITPYYSGMVGRGWLARGGTYVVANIRGGGEYGPSWHTAALRENRHRAYEDFAAVARDLVERGITTPERLAIHGGSNGGLLMGVMLTRYPELFGAIVIMVPLLDMKRYHLLLAGASWMAEYGDPDVESDWEFISGYSPYQNLRADAELPPVLVTTSTRDDRVHPGHARKMVARMREQGHRVEYYENIEGGHGGAADNAQRAFQWALVYEFCWRHVGAAATVGT